MNLYAPLAEFEEAKRLLSTAAAYLHLETMPPSGCAEGVLEARDLLRGMALRAVSDYRTVDDALRMDRDDLFDMLAVAYGHEIYWEQERPVARAMIEICAEQYPEWSYRECSKAIANKYDADRLGDAL